MSDMTLVFGILGVTIALFVSGRFPSDLVAIGSLLTLFRTGILNLSEAFAGFSNSTVPADLPRPDSVVLAILRRSAPALSPESGVSGFFRLREV